MLERGTNMSGRFLYSVPLATAPQEPAILGGRFAPVPRPCRLGAERDFEHKDACPMLPQRRFSKDCMVLVHGS